MVVFFLADTVHTLNLVLTSLQRPLLYNGHFFFFADSPYTESCFNFFTTATSLQRPFFSLRTVHILTLVSTSLQRPPLYNGHLTSTAIFLPADSPYIDSCVNLFRMATCLLWPLYYIDTDEIPGFFRILKNHIVIARSEDTIFIFHV